MLELLFFIPMLAFLLVSALCSATETTLFGLTHADRVELERRHPVAFRAAVRVMAQPRGALITILVINTVANTAFFVLSSMLSARSESGLVATAIGVVSVSAALMLGEVVPKLLGNAHRVAFATLLAPLTLVAARTLGPLRVVLDSGLVGPLARVLVVREKPPPLRTEELAALLDSASSEGLIERDDHRLLADVVGLNQLRVRDVMTPRGDVAWIVLTGGVDAVIEAARTTRRSLLPVCETTPDDAVVGMLRVRAALGEWAQRPGRQTDLRRWMTPACFVPDRSRLDQLLEYFRSNRTDTAVCVDETGGVTGVVGIDDVVRALGLAPTEGRELEHDQVERVGPNQWSVSGRLPVHDWAALFGAGAGAAALDRRASTVAGLVILALGRMPREGDEARLGRLSLRVLAMAGRSVERVVVTLTEAADAPNAA